MKSTVAAVVWLMANSAFAEAGGVDGQDLALAEHASQSSNSGVEDVRPLKLGGLSGEGPATALPVRISSDQYPHAAYLKSYHVGGIGEVNTVAAVQLLSASAAADSFIRHQTGIDPRATLSADRWLAQRSGLAQTFAVGNGWRDLTFEGAAFSGRDDGQRDRPQEIRKIDSRSARLSFSPADNWVVRLSRGTVSGLDHLVAGDQVRRTALSATYRRALEGGDWEATFAWGRNSRKFRESTVGYLMETAFRFDGVHSLFGRVEQVGSDEIARENESLQRQLFTMNKLTLGYSQDLRLSSTLSLDAGAYVTRYFVPTNMSPSYGSGPTAYMMFVRVKLK